MFVVSEELLQLVSVEASCLLVDERSLCEHGVCSFLHHVLQFLVSYGETKFGSFIFDEACLHVRVPDHVLHLVHLFFREAFASLCHFDDLLVFVQEVLDLLNTDFLSEHFSDLLSAVVAQRVCRAYQFFCNECEKRETDD